MIDTPVLLQQATENWRGQADVFSEIFLVFLVVGTLVGIVVVTYTLYHVYRYRGTRDGEESEGLELGELPSGQGGGKSKKLFLSFGLSAIIVISVVVYSYTLLLYVEEGPSSEIETQGNGDAMDIQVTGIRFLWQFEYPNGATEVNTLRVPAGEEQMIRLHVTSGDVWHTFGVTDLRLKLDAIPGETNTGWFIADEPGSYQIECFELCGAQHSQMTGEIQVMEEDEFNDWYEGTGEEAADGDSEGDS
jgi:cytochrome c oxidase subunit 2